jgi:hypothetical protein
MNFFSKPDEGSSAAPMLMPAVPCRATAAQCSCRSWWERLRAWLRWPWQGWLARPPRQLRLCETLALGERRFLVVVEFASQKFLIGTSANAITLLTELQQTGGHMESPAPEPERDVAVIGMMRGKDAAE